MCKNKVEAKLGLCVAQQYKIIIRNQAIKNGHINVEFGYHR